MRTILFVCTGNTCRSPMAEAIARHTLDRGLAGVQPDIFVASAGVQAQEGAMPTSETLLTLRQMGIEHSGRSKRLTAQMIRKADLVLCMTASQQETAQQLVADSQAEMQKIVLLDPEADIEDPIGLGQEAYDALGERLSALLPQRLRDLLANAPSQRSQARRE